MLPQPFVLAAVLGLVLVVAVRPRTAAGRGALEGLVVAGAMALALSAAWPLLDLQFETDAPVLRAAFAAVDVFGDWNHPFLPYLLERPATWVSLAPRVLRAVPLVFLLAEVGLTSLAAARLGGPLAGGLAGAWFACEVRRRHGLVDLGDWDIAGAFLVALVIWAMRPRASRAAWIGVAALLVLGVLSSWLMIVPAAVLVGCLALEARRDRVRAKRVAAIAIVVAVLAALALRVFVAGARSIEPGHAREIFGEMLEESPVGRSLAMAVPLAIGLVVVIRRSRALPERFVAATLVAVPAAVALAFRASHVNGGYYAGLVTPLACLAAGVGTARVLAAIETRLTGGDEGAAVRRLGILVSSGLTAIVGGATIFLVGAPIGGGMQDAPALLAAMKGDARPVWTNSAALARLLAFERARRGEGAIADVLARENGPADLVTRTRPLPPATCAPPEPGYVALFINVAERPTPACLAELEARCRALGSPELRDGRTVVFGRCD